MEEKNKEVENFFNDNHKNALDMIHAFRKRINEFLLGGNNIDRLMTEKVEDYILIEEQPMSIFIGKKRIFVGNLTLQNDYKFFNQWALLITNLNARILNMDLAEDRRKELLEKASFHLLGKGKDLFEFFTMDKWLYEKLIRLIGQTVLKQQSYYLDQIQGERKKIKWKNCNYRYFKKNITKETLIQICFTVFLYNFDAVKKNLAIILEKMDLQQNTETYMYFWLQNLSGLIGKFQLAQSIKFDSFIKDGEKIKVDMQGNKIQENVESGQSETN